MTDTNVSTKRGHRIAAEIGDDLWRKLRDEAANRSTVWRKVTPSEVIREILAERFGMLS